MHYVGVVFTGEDITGATHVCGELIDLIEAAIDNGATKALVPQVVVVAPERPDTVTSFRELR